MPRSEDFPKYTPETQIALLRQELQRVHEELETTRERLRDLEHQPILTDAQIRELCRRIFIEESEGNVSLRDSWIRLLTFAAALVSLWYVVTGGG